MSLPEVNALPGRNGFREVRAQTLPREDAATTKRHRLRIASHFFFHLSCLGFSCDGWRRASNAQLSNPVRWVIVLQMGAFLFFTRRVLVSLTTGGGERQMGSYQIPSVGWLFFKWARCGEEWR